MSKIVAWIVLVAACGGKTAPAPEPRRTDRSIRAVDWKRGETPLYYDARDEELTPDQWAQRHPGEEPVARGYREVAAPAYGDVDHDGSEDAAITTTTNAGGSGELSAIALYAMRDGAPVAFAQIPGGDRADGGIADVVIAASGDVLVERFVDGGEGACCPGATVHEVWRWNGGALVEDRARRSLPLPL